MLVLSLNRAVFAAETALVVSADTALGRLSYHPIFPPMGRQ